MTFYILSTMHESSNLIMFSLTFDSSHLIECKEAEASSIDLQSLMISGTEDICSDCLETFICFVFFFNTGFPCVSLAVLELSL